MIVFHDDPFTPADRQPTPIESPGAVPGIRLLSPIPDEWVPLAAHALRLRVGARNLEPSQWVSPRDADWEPTLAMKRGLVAERPQDVIACLPGAEEACDEVAAGVMGSVGEPLSSSTGIDALVDASLCVADDLCILQEDAHGVPVLTAAVLCSPNRWLLREKIGGTLAQIHSPVARYDTDLDSPVNAVMKRLTPDRPIWRINWGLSNHPALFQPVAPEATPGMDPGDLWFRVEWQTLRRLPVTGAILFTIRTHVQKLSDFRERDIRLVHDFAELVLFLEDKVAQYKSIAPYKFRVYDYLSARSR